MMAERASILPIRRGWNWAAPAYLDTAIVGTINPEHLQTNLDILKKGPLPPDLHEEAKPSLAFPARRHI